MKKHSSVSKQSELSRKVERRDTREVMSELVAQLQKQVDKKQEPGQVAEVPTAERPNLNRMTVGVDLGDEWSNYCVLGLGGETLAEGQFRMRREEVQEFFQGLASSRVVFEVGTHSAWVREVSPGSGMKCWWQMRAGCTGRSGAGARMTGSMQPCWPGSGAWIRKRCIRFSIAVRKCGRIC